MKRYTAFILSMWLGIISATVAAGDDGGTESIFNLGAGARAMGMGNGYTALAEDATVVYYNPAGIPFITSQQVSLLHTVLFAGTVYDFASYVYPYASVGGIGIAGMRIGTDDIGRRDAITDLGRFSATRMQLILSYGRRIGTRFSGGINLKLAHQAIDNYSAYGMGIDLAGRAVIIENLHAGVLLQDVIGPRLKLAAVSERTPFTLRGGLAYTRDLPRLPLSATATFDLEKPEKRSVKVRTGLEIAHNTGLAIRGGFDRDNATLGMGLRYQQLTFDYAYKFMDDLSDSHRFSLAYRFGATAEEREERLADEERRMKSRLLTNDRQESLRWTLREADDYFKAGQLDSALAAYYRADAFADDKSKGFIAARIDGIKYLLSGAAVSKEQKTAEYRMADRAAEIVRQAEDLLDKGALTAARDLVYTAIAGGIESEELLALRASIDARIDVLVRGDLSGAEEAITRRDYVEAYNQYNRVLSYDINNRLARDGSRTAKMQLDIAQHLKLALDYYDQERYMLSQKEFNTVLRLEPKNETARDYLARIEEQLRASGTQEERELREDKDMWQVYLDGVEAYRAGDFKKAIQLWKKVLEKYPNDRMTLDNIRQAELREKE